MDQDYTRVSVMAKGKLKVNMVCLPEQILVSINIVKFNFMNLLPALCKI